MKQLIQDAKALLKLNDTGVFIKPSTHQYPHIWNWDSAFIAIALSHYDLEQAKKEVRALLSGQWQSGLVPHILYPTGASDYFPTPDFWQTEALPTGPSFPTSGFTQPPILATAVKKILNHSADESFLKEVYPKLLAWHRWLYRARDPENTGLVSIIHPWEAGTDNSPRFDEPLANLKPVNVPEFKRRDKKHVSPDERPVEDHYVRFMYLIGFYRDLKWHDTAIYEQTPFLVQDVLFNTLLHQANQDLLSLAQQLGEPCTEIEDWLERTSSAFETLWDDEMGMYLDKDVRQNNLLKINSLQALSPIFAGIPSKANAERLVTEHLLNKQEFAPADDSAYCFPTIAKNTPYFEPRRYWRGPIWLNMNWIMYWGLKQYGYDELATKVKADSIKLAQKSDFVEYYDPRDGSACGAKGFSWSAALVTDMLLTD